MKHGTHILFCINDVRYIHFRNWHFRIDLQKKAVALRTFPPRIRYPNQPPQCHHALGGKRTDLTSLGSRRGGTMHPQRWARTGSLFVISEKLTEPHGPIHVISHSRHLLCGYDLQVRPPRTHFSAAAPRIQNHSHQQWRRHQQLYSCNIPLSRGHCQAFVTWVTLPDPPLRNTGGTGRCKLPPPQGSKPSVYQLRKPTELNFHC